jgi:hypothetical protein
MYAPGVQRGAVEFGSSTTGMTLEGTEFRYNYGTGLRIRHNAYVAGVNCHHNAILGLNATDATAPVIFASQFNWNNISLSERTFEAGGLKLWETDGAILRGCVGHDNFGKYIWLDNDNINYLIERNLSYNNEQQGIYIEICMGAGGIVRHNYCIGDQWEGATFGGIRDPIIEVRNSANCWIYGNTVVVMQPVTSASHENSAIAANNNDRGSSPTYGAPLL